MGKFDDIRNKVDCATGLADLFNLWEEAHKEESYCSFFETSAIDIQPNTISVDSEQKWSLPINNSYSKSELDHYKSNFIFDGITSANGCEKYNYDPNGIDVLFILEESNASDSILKHCFPTCYDESSYWFNKNPDDPVRKRYLYVLNNYLCYLKKQGIKTDKFGYMNINKRGGLGSTNDKHFKSYIKIYMPFILKEIQLLAPKYIFMCTKVYNVFASNKCFKQRYKKDPELDFFYSNNSSSPYIIKIWHPAKPGKKVNERSCDALKKIFKNNYKE